MKIKVYLHYLKLKDFMDYQPIYIKTSFSSADDIETFIDLRKVFLVKQSQGMLVRRKRWYEILFHTKSIK